MSDKRPYGITLFCDDIRSEQGGGQLTLVGSYIGGMVIKGFPATLPKFGFFVTFVEPRELAEKRDF